MSSTQAGFENRSAIVTGGGKGIGAATASALSVAGARVTLFDTDATAGAAHARGLAQCTFMEVDITDRDAVGEAVDAVIERAGAVDMLVNNAGIAPRTTLAQMRPEDWQAVIDVNLTGTFNCVDAVVPGMKSRRRGAIVNVSSIAGKNISLGAGLHYTTTKWGIIGLSRHLAYELAPFGIRVNIVCPGPAVTTLLGLDEEQQRRVASSVPLGRAIEPDDVAGAIVFLLGPGAAMCTGSELVIDGGVLLGPGDAYESYFALRGEVAPTRDGG